MRTALILPLMICATACGGDQPSERADASAAPAAAAQQIAAMPEAQRNAVFIRAIRDARMECQHVESSSRAGAYEGHPVWTARCTGGGNWTIVIGDNGVAQILNADEARLVQPSQPQN